MPRIVMILLFLTFVPACAARYQPAGPICCDNVLNVHSQEAGHHEIFTATMQDGMVLHGRRWLAGKEKAVILALHGFGDYSMAFDDVATWWQAKGITVYAPDQRGFGNSAEHGIWAGADTYADDATQMLSLVREKHPGHKVFGLGMSMGGAITLVAADNGARYDGLILAAPAVLDKEDLPLYQRIALWGAANLFPAAEPSGSNVNRQPTDNLDMLRKMAKDPLYYKRSRLDTVAGLIEVMDRAMHVADAGRLPPVLLLSGAKDELVELEKTTDFVDRLAANPHMQNKVVRQHYKNGWHMLLRDSQRRLVWQDVADYVVD